MKELMKSFDGQKVRVILNGGVEWFVEKDVCEILGIVDHIVAIRNLRE
jgi:prophage antirepressor-like protein